MNIPVNYVSKDRVNYCRMSVTMAMKQYTDGILNADEFADRLYDIATYGIMKDEWYVIINLNHTYREECRSVVSNFDKYGWDKSQLSRMASAYKAMKDAIDNECYPNVVEGTNL